MKKLTRQQAINQYCKECIFDPKSEGNWKKQTQACTHTPCPLYPYRPKSRAESHSEAVEVQK